MKTAHSLSPLAPKAYPDFPILKGVRFAATTAQIRYLDRLDLTVVLFDREVALAGCYTRSLTRSAPVEWCARNTPTQSARAIVVNSGNSNAFTGKRGVETVEETTRSLSELLACSAESIFVASTGVIGEPLDAAKITTAFPQLIATARETDGMLAARAIMTTDTFPKMATHRIVIQGKTVTLNGFAKGSGMIAPDMATLLAFVFTDAEIPAPLLQTLLRHATDRSFNLTTVDSDTSTSDTLLLAATGEIPLGFKIDTPLEDKDLALFSSALEKVCIELAQMVVRDGEGARKFITVRVSGAVSNASAKKIALSIANSPLVKTAIAGEDANWGRVVMAVGKAGEPADRDRLSIKMGGVYVARCGERAPEWDDDVITRHFKGQEILIEVEMGMGSGESEVWTCDLTHGYITINGSYRS